jgi:hypothetical protein
MEQENYLGNNDAVKSSALSALARAQVASVAVGAARLVIRAAIGIGVRAAAVGAARQLAARVARWASTSGARGSALDIGEGLKRER